jgi:hypothetical protein
MIRHQLWLWQFAIEEKRQHYATRRHLWRQALCCIALILLGGGADMTIATPRWGLLGLPLPSSEIVYLTPPPISHNKA